MNRVLVLTNEAARHPFRQRLPRHMFVAAALPEVPERAPMTSLVFFLASFAAGFVVFLGLIL
jgi:hypothetical protein